MKTEFEIAQRNIGNFLSTKKDNLVRTYCKEHKATCQRFLEFLKEFWNNQLLCSARNIGGRVIDNMNEKITDLKNTIKLYSENGI